MRLSNINNRIRNLAKSPFRNTDEFLVQQDILRKSNYGKYNRKEKVWEFKNIKNQQILARAIENYKYQVPTLHVLKKITRELDIEPEKLHSIAQGVLDLSKNYIASEYIRYALIDAESRGEELDTKSLFDLVDTIYSTYTDSQISDLRDKYVAEQGF